MADKLAHLESILAGQRLPTPTASVGAPQGTHSPVLQLQGPSNAEAESQAMHDSTLQVQAVDTMLSDDTAGSVHGPSSSFRVPMCTPKRDGVPGSGSPPPNATVSERDKVDMFAWSALQRQKEASYVFDGAHCLDGVDASVASYLLGLFWRHQYHTFLQAHRPTITESIANGGPYANRLLMNALYYVGAMQSGQTQFMDDPGNPTSLGGRFLRRFQTLLATDMECSSIATICALILVGSGLLSQGRLSLGWLYSGLSYRMVVDLGLHIDIAKKGYSGDPTGMGSLPRIRPREQELQRRIFWGSYLHDRFQSLYYGRPPALQVHWGFEPPIELLDTYEEHEPWVPGDLALKPVTAQPGHSVSNRSALVRLAMISSDIVESFYLPREVTLNRVEASNAVRTIDQKLQAWDKELAQHLRYRVGRDPTPPPHRLYTHTTYSTLVILLYRPFLPDGHLGKLGLSPTLSAKEHCINAALHIYALARAYKESFSLGRAPWLFSYAVFSAATVFPMDGQNNESRLEVITFFWEALRELQRGANNGLKRPMAIIRKMFERAGIDTNALHARLDSTVVSHRASRAQSEVDGQQDAVSGWATQDLPLQEDQIDDFRHLFEDTMAEDVFGDWGLLDEPDSIYGLFGSGGDVPPMAL